MHPLQLCKEQEEESVSVFAQSAPAAVSLVGTRRGQLAHKALTETEQEEEEEAEEGRTE